MCPLSLGFIRGPLGAKVAFMPLLPELRRASRRVVTINMALLTELFAWQPPPSSLSICTQPDTVVLHPRVPSDIKCAVNNHKRATAPCL